jgi:hypothetical protein
MLRNKTLGWFTATLRIVEMASEGRNKDRENGKERMDRYCRKILVILRIILTDVNKTSTKQTTDGITRAM